MDLEDLKANGGNATLKQAGSAAPAKGHNDGEDSRAHYDFVVDVNSDSTHAKVIDLVGENRRVLELGPASGYMSEVMRQRGCTVIGIELDADMASQAERFCERVIVGDLDALDLEGELGEGRFDVIVAADVLEHLRDPLAVLRRLRAFLAPNGFFVVSLPNVAHASVRLALLQGRFEYGDLGLLDRTHLRFFTRESIGELFDEAELAIVEMRIQEALIQTAEVEVDLDKVPAGLAEDLERDPEARAYQFIVKAVPLQMAGLRELQRRVREQALSKESDEREITRLRGRLSEVERALVEIGGREGQVRTALIDAHDQLLCRDEEIEKLNELVKDLEASESRLRQELDALREAREDMENLRAQLSARDEQIRRLRVRLQRILGSPPFRLYYGIGRLPLFRSIVARRTAGYLQAVESADPSSDQ